MYEYVSTDKKMYYPFKEWKERTGKQFFDDSETLDANVLLSWDLTEFAESIDKIRISINREGQFYEESNWFAKGKKKFNNFCKKGEHYLGHPCPHHRDLSDDESESEEFDFEPEYSSDSEFNYPEYS